jgi:hypothetical protein
VLVGYGNDHIDVGNGNNIVEGNGRDDMDGGNGDNLIVAGLVCPDVQVATATTY